MAILYVVATPIGNLSDMTPRAIETMQKVDLIAAEDTRVTQKLLSVFDIHTPLTSCHEHNERNKATYIVGRMVEEGIDVAVTTDAGTPCISDPGSILVAEAVKAGIEVVAVAGPTAMAAAISVSGFPVEEYTFVGFLPRAKKELIPRLEDIATRIKVAVVHESPHRVIDLLEVVQSVLPHTMVSASCDLTKKYERTERGTVDEVLTALKQNPKSNKGEYCLVLMIDPADIPAPKVAVADVSLEARLFDLLMQDHTLRDAMQMLTASGERKNAVYSASLKVKEMMGEG